MKKPFQWTSLILLLLPLSACALSGGPIEGRVLDAETKQPIAGAIVVAAWRGDIFAWVESRSVCVHVESVVTDSQGRYKLPHWSKPSTIGWVRDLYTHPVAYKPGYAFFNPDGHTDTDAYRKDHVLYLQAFKGTREERLRYLERAGVSCVSAGASKRNAYRLSEAIYFEAKTLGASKSDLDAYRRAAAYDGIAEDGYREGEKLESLLNEFLREHLK